MIHKENTGFQKSYTEFVAKHIMNSEWNMKCSLRDSSHR